MRTPLFIASLATLTLQLAACKKNDDAPATDGAAPADAPSETKSPARAGPPEPARFVLDGGQFENQAIELGPIEGAESYWLYSTQSKETLISVRGEQSGTSTTLSITLPVDRPGRHVLEGSPGDRPRVRMRLSRGQGRQVMELLGEPGFVVDIQAVPDGNFLNAKFEGTLKPMGPAGEDGSKVTLKDGQLRVPFNPAPGGKRLSFATQWGGKTPVGAEPAEVPAIGYLDFEIDGKQQRWSLLDAENKFVRLDDYQNVQIVGRPGDNPEARFAITVNGHDLDALKYPAKVPVKGGTSKGQPAAAGLTYVDYDGDKFIGFAGSKAKVNLELEKWDPKTKTLVGKFDGMIKSPKDLPPGKSTVVAITGGTFEIKYPQ